MKRQVFFSFEYAKDNWRASMVRNMRKVDSSSTLSDNDWEEVKNKSSVEIKKWIDSEMEKRSCIVVLIGSTTSTRYWVEYEIKRAYELNKGLVGIYINKLEDKFGMQSNKGSNPFYNVFSRDGHRLSYYVKCFDSNHSTSKFVYDDISNNIESLVENAIIDRKTY